MADKRKGDMTVSEAGRMGGAKVASERGHEFYEEIGKKGGEKVASERGHAFYEEIGKKGGEKVASERGHAFYEEIGKKGGQKVRELIERGKKGAAPTETTASETTVESEGGEPMPREGEDIEE